MRFCYGVAPELNNKNGQVRSATATITCVDLSFFITMAVPLSKPTLIAAATAASSLSALAYPSFNGAPSAFVPSVRRTLSTNNVVSGTRRIIDASVGAGVSLAAQPGKGDLYNDEELFELLTIHQALSSEDQTGTAGLFGGNNDGTAIADGEQANEESIVGGIHDWVLDTLNEVDAQNSPPSPTNEDVAEVSGIPGLHDLVLEAIADIDAPSSTPNPKVEEQEDGACASPNQMAFNNLQTLLRDKKPSITAIASDVDGTLLEGQTLHPTTKEAILKAIDQSYNNNNDSEDELSSSKIQHFFPATGKSRKGAIISLGPTIGPLLYQIPGVYIQGLYCVDKEGNVVFEKKLSSTAVHAAEELMAECSISIVGYDGDDLYTTEQTDVVISLSEVYGEPTVELCKSSDDEGMTIKLAEHGPLHKLLLMDEDVDKLKNVVRPKLEELADRHGATVTQAVPTMLELLPEGCSKAYGVGKVCEALGIDPTTELLALGDAENDVGMLRNAAIGVAVGNACPQAMDAADFIMTERNDEGGAGLAMNLFGFDV